MNDAQDASVAPEPDDATAGYTAFQHWNYEPIIYKVDHKQSWRDVGESFYRASALLVAKLAAGELSEDVEGVAAVFLFRHYLELVLKRIVLRGRSLKREDQNAAEHEVGEVAKIHRLEKLWHWVQDDAKPKIKAEDWDNYDTAFVEKCIAEFDGADEKGFAFRYSGAGGEFYQFDFDALLPAMEHVYQVLEGIETYLVESHRQNEEYDEYLEWEYGDDLNY